MKFEGVALKSGAYGRGAFAVEEKAKVESGGKYSYGCTLNSGEEIIVTRVGGRWAFATTDMSNGATCEDFPNNGRTTRRIFGVTDEALSMIETLVKSIRADQSGAAPGVVPACPTGGATTEMQKRMDDGSVVYVSRGGKSGMWEITITSPSIGAYGIEPTDEQMKEIARLVNYMLGNGVDRSELAKRIESLEAENDEIRGAYDIIREENDSMRSIEDHQFADVYSTLRETLGIDEPGNTESVVDTVQGLIDDLTDARSALNALADLKVYKAKNGANERYRHVKPEVWARVFRILGRGKEIELGALKEKTEPATTAPMTTDLMQEATYDSVVRTMERHKHIRDEVDATLRNMETTPSCNIEWIRDALNRINDLADGATLLFGKDAPAIPEEFRSDELRKLYEHMVRGQIQALRDVKARFNAIFNAAGREISIIGDTGRCDKERERILSTLTLISRIACGSAKVEPESK